MVDAHFKTFDSAVAPAATDLIARVAGVIGKRPVSRGTRITVASVKGRVSGGDSLDDLMADHPEVTREAFEAAVAYDDRHVEAHAPLGGPRRQV